jgi:hypothetical protein
VGLLVGGTGDRLSRGAGWQTGQKNEDLFMKVIRRIGVPQRRQGWCSRP